jgi:lactoylglutathione lyase
MYIHHIAMYVKDLEEAKNFFVKYFNATSSQEYHNRNTNFRSYFLTFEDGAQLELMHRHIMTDNEKHPTRTGYAHIAISVGNQETVDRLTAQLKNDGYTVLSGPRTTGDGHYESCIVGIENNVVEITV